MGVKKKADTPRSPVLIERKFTYSDHGDHNFTEQVQEFLHAADIPHQMAALKKIFIRLKQQQSANEVTQDILLILAEGYFNCPAKHVLKRAIASGLQGLPAVYHRHVIQTLCSEFANTLHKSFHAETESAEENLPVDASLRPRATRHNVNNVAALLENFPLGEQSVTEMCCQVLTYLAVALEKFMKSIDDCDSPVLLTERMHDCLATVKEFNKVLQKSQHQVQLYLQAVDGDSPVPLQVRTALHRFYTSVWNVLKEENFLLDCRGTCGMSVPLLLRTLHRQSPVLQILRCIFPGYSVPECQDTSQDPVLVSPVSVETLPISSYLSLCQGTLAMLELTDLVDQYQPGHTLLVQVIGQELLHAVDNLKDTNTRLVASRALVLWSSKACACLKDPACEDRSVLLKSLHGEADLPQKLLHYAGTHWDDPVDVIRHQARIVFENILKCHLLATGENPKKSSFLERVAQSLLDLSWQLRGKYGPLCCITEHLGASVMLHLQPSLPRHLVTAATTEQSLASHSTELFEMLARGHQEELLSDCQNEADVLVQWQKTWIDPVIHVLCDGTKTQKQHCTEYLVPSMLRLGVHNMNYIITTLSGQQSDHLGPLMTCIKRARVVGLLGNQGGDQRDMWNGVVPISTIKLALCHQEDQIRLDALGMLCEYSKTTEVIRHHDLHLVVNVFLPNNMCNQSPGFRQSMVALLKKLFVRVKDGSYTLRRKLMLSGKECGEDWEALCSYKRFLQSLCDRLFECLHPGASFPSRTTALSILSTLVQTLGVADEPVDDIPGPYVMTSVTEPRVQALLECLVDTFEENKKEAFNVLIALPLKFMNLEDKSRMQSLFDASLELASSTRPQDCTTAAYLLRLLLKHPELQPVLDSTLEQEGHHACNTTAPSPCDTTESGSETEEVREEGKAVSEEELFHRQCLAAVQILVLHCQQQVEVARQNLLHAAATRPLYPTLHCMRYILADVKFSKLCVSSKWRRCIMAVVDTCFQVAAVVAPVVANSSPEGNIPTDANIVPLCAENSAEKGSRSLAVEESMNTVSLMPEYLTVCCWRSIKEVSLLLGQLTQDLPITDEHGDCSDGLLSTQQIDAIGSYFTTQLLESRHRGAFELAYAGFVKMTYRLWRCPQDGVHQLPKQWLQLVMTDIKSNDPNSRLCATRRSAGVPFYVQALVTTEPTATGRGCFKQVMGELLQLALQVDQYGTQENPAKVHSLNILRAMYKDTRLGDDVFPYLAQGLQAAITGFSSQLWSIRNCSTLLFSALITRVFGVKKNKDDHDKKNCMTGRVFFKRFPTLFQFLLDKLTEAVEDSGQSGNFQLSPGLYPVLMVLGRLFPSVVEGVDSSLNLTEFIPHVIRCAHSPVYKTRMMAARAIRPLVSKDQIAAILHDMVKSLPTDAMQHVTHNYVHGILLQINYIIQELNDLPSAVVHQVADQFLPEFCSCTWLASRQNACFLTRAAYIDVAHTVLGVHWTPGETVPCHLVDMRRTILHIVQEELSSTTRHDVGVPGSAEFNTIIAKYCMICTVETQLTNSDSHKNISWNVVDTINTFLRSSAYEVQLEGLRLCQQILHCPNYDPWDNDDELTTNTNKKTILNEHIGQTLQASTKLFNRLVAMVMDGDTYPECLIGVLNVLSKHQMTVTKTWPAGNKHMGPSEVFKMMLELHKSTNRDEIRCTTLQVCGVLFQTMYTQLQQSGDAGRERAVIEDWCRQLEVCCNTEQSVHLHYTCASVLLHNALTLLTDPQHCLGDVVWRAWVLLIRLLQDEDEDVRNLCARVPTKLIEHPSVDHKYLNHHMGDVEEMRGASIQPTLALRLAIHLMVGLYYETDWCGCFSLLFKLITQDLEPPWQTTEQEVRLFDKGEMNTYREDATFVQLLANVMYNFISHTMMSTASAIGSEAANSATEPRENAESHKAIMDLRIKSVSQGSASLETVSSLIDIHVRQLRDDKQLQMLVSNDKCWQMFFNFCLETLVKFQEQVRSHGGISHEQPFLNTSRYHCNKVAEFRLLQCIWSLQISSKDNQFQIIAEKLKQIYCSHGVCNEMLSMALNCLVKRLPTLQ